MSSFKKRALPSTLTANGRETPADVSEVVESDDLPATKAKSINSLEQIACIIYGARGIGKSTLANAIFHDEALFEMFETDRTLEVYARDVREWGRFKDDVEMFLRGDTPVKYSGLVADNGAVAYEVAMDYACKLHGFDHPGGMNDYGASWNKVKKEFTAPFRKLLSSRYGLAVICHEMEKEIETRGGRKFMMMRPDWSKQADDYLSSFVENIFYYYYVGDQRWLQIVGDEYITAKVKLKHNFFTPDGERIVRVPMGNSIEEAYKNLMLAFNNKQTDTYADIGRKEAAPAEAATTSKFKKKQ